MTTTTAYIPAADVKVGDFLIAYDGKLAGLRETKARYYVTVEGETEHPIPIDKRQNVLVRRSEV